MDRSRSPAYFVTFHGKPTMADVASHLANLDTVLAQQQRYGMLIDMRAGGSMPREGVKLFAEWNRKNGAAIERLTVGSALVITGAVTRAALSAAMWLQPIPGPYAIFQDYALAEKWLRAAMREARLPLYSTDGPPGFIANEA